MNEILNLVEILKDAPKGTKLWSPICGDCEFMEVGKDGKYPIVCISKTNEGYSTYVAFAADGKFYYDYINGECVLFPSKENRDWSTFKVPKKHKEFKPFQKVLVKYYVACGKYVWGCALYSHYDEASNRHFIMNFGSTVNDDNVIPFDGNEEKLGKTVE